MKSTSTGISMWRMRSERKNTAPLRTPMSSRFLSCVVAGDLFAQLAHPPAEILGRDEDLPDRWSSLTPGILGGGCAACF